VAAGDLHRPGRRGRKVIDDAVHRFEAATGLQLTVVLGDAGDRDPHELAEALFVDAGLVERPAVLVLVAARQHRVEVLTAPDVRVRISDEDAASAVAAMTAEFRRRDLVGGLTRGIEQLAAAAGPGQESGGGTDLPNIVGGP
jgi:uncharacterized membrane protein YgcG